MKVLQEDQNMLTISVMTEADAGFATELATVEEWGYLEEDFRRLIYLEPEGCFVARMDGKRVGIVTTTRYGDYAFIGSLIVSAEDRGKGIGEALVSRGVNYLTAHGVRTMELDGVFAAVSLYRRLGFADKYLSLRFEGEGRGSRDEASCYTPEMTEAIVRFDREQTGLSRARVVRKLLTDFRESVWAVGEEGIAGYVIVRRRSDGQFTIGPLVAETRQAADLLLGSVVAGYAGETLTIGVPETNRDAVLMLLENGFQYAEPSLRMYLGERRDYEGGVHGIIAPEKG